jgi:predicted PurR-regulated permease PerM
MTMETLHAAMFTAYMVPVGLLDNILKPVLMARGLATPMPVIVIGVIGGTIAYGIIGLFFGPIILSVAWELTAAWMSSDKPVLLGDTNTGKYTAVPDERDSDKPWGSQVR